MLAKAQDYKGFFEQEIELRKQLDNPPFCELISVMFKGKSQKAAASAAERTARDIDAVSDGKIRAMYGPSPAPLKMLGGMYRYRILLKCEAGSNTDILAKAYARHKEGEYAQRVGFDIDINPASMF